MSLNIKNEAAHKLASRVARLTGESLTEAVTTALRERLEKLTRDDGKERANRLMAIGRDCASRLKGRSRTISVDELLYDERGLPK